MRDDKDTIWITFNEDTWIKDLAKTQEPVRETLG